MANITDYLNSISNAVKGKDVRQAIHDAIQQCYYDGNAGSLDLQARQSIQELEDQNEDLQDEITDLNIKLNSHLNFKQVDSFSDGYGHMSIGYKCGNVVVYFIKYFTTSPVDDTNTASLTTIHTIPESVGTPITPARAASDLDVVIRTGESYVRSVCPESVAKVNVGSRDIKLATKSTTVQLTLWFLVEEEEEEIDVHTHIVNELPTTDIDTNAIYFLANNSGENVNAYDEYIFINNSWEKLGGYSVPFVYSASEKVVGTWIDNKPIYQKTVYISSLPNASTSNIAHGITNISAFVGIESFIKWSNGWIANTPWIVYGDETELITISLGLTSIQIVTKKDRSSMSAYVTLRYTKTTD